MLTVVLLIYIPYLGRRYQEMAGHKLYLKYVQPVVSGIDGVFSLLEGIDVLKCFVPDLREHYNDCPITSLPTVTEEVLQKLLKPNSFEYVLKTSKVLEIIHNLRNRRLRCSNQVWTQGKRESAGVLQHQEVQAWYPCTLRFAEETSHDFS